MKLPFALLAAALAALSQTAGAQRLGPLGLFSHQGNIGNVTRRGNMVYSSGRGTYQISGGGANMWSTNDAFHFAWKQATGDISISADIRFDGTNGAPHRKACLMIRQSLAPDSAYADAALHGNGMVALQFREEQGAPTGEVQAAMSAPARIGLQKRGDYITMSVAGPGEQLHPCGAAFRLPLQEPFYIGLAICAHDSNAVTGAEISNLQVVSFPPVAGPLTNGGTTLEVVPIGSKDRRVVFQTNDHIEAPNWTRDGKHFVFNSHGHLYKLPVAGGQPELIDTGIATRCNNDHGFSPDGALLAISDSSQNGKSQVYVLPATGGAPRLVTPDGPSYWHGWSPDGATLAFAGIRNGEPDVYTIPAAGGAEKRLTTAPGLDDGPDYSPDGAFIYFNSERTGFMQIWRMKADGSEQEQITSDDYNNWFPHPSPDGKWIVFLSYGKEVKGHPGNKDVALRLMPAGGGKIQVLAKLFGGQGTINVPSWSPDSKEVAFVSYLPVYKDPLYDAPIEKARQSQPSPIRRY